MKQQEALEAQGGHHRPLLHELGQTAGLLVELPPHPSTTHAATESVFAFLDRRAAMVPGSQSTTVLASAACH